jgi:peptide/nickel transport system substrate-binding protein
MHSAARSATPARRWSVRLLALTVVCLLVDNACRTTPRPAASPAPVHLTIALALPASVKNANSADIGLNGILYLLSTDRLIRVGTDGRPGGGLAERWERSPDGLTWRFFLRPNLRFQNGSPLDAPHVAANLSAAAPQAFAGAGLQEVVSVTAEGSTTLVFHLRRPSSLFLPALVGLSISTGTGATRSEAGAFQVVSRQPGAARLRGFSDYYRGRPTLDTIDVKVYPNPRNAWSAMMRGEVDFLYDVTPEAIDFVEQSSRAEVKTFLRPYVYMIGMNLRHPALKRREVRIALNQAVNRTQIIDVVFRGRAYPASSYIWPRHWAYDHLVPRFRFLPDVAGRMLDEAGLPLKTVTAGRPKTRFSFVCLIADLDPRYERIALMLQQQLLEIGVDMQLQAQPTMDLMRRLNSGDYDAVLLDLASTPGLTSVYDSWHSPGERPASLFQSGYATADEALDGLEQANTDDEMRAALHRVQLVMHDDPPAIFLCWGERARAVSTRFRVPVLPDRDVTSTLAEWRLVQPGPTRSP